MNMYKYDCTGKFVYYTHSRMHGYTPLHFAAMGGHFTCVERLLSTPGIDVDTAFQSIFNHNLCLY